MLIGHVMKPNKTAAVIFPCHRRHQGPPGTGKTRALTIMAMSMCRVFCESPASSQSLAFDLPSRQAVDKWGTELVVQWVHSWKTDGEGGPITKEAKAVAGQTLQVRVRQ